VYIFEDEFRSSAERDRKLWLARLGEACEKTGWRIHAWVMMNDHYHLLLETPEANLVAGMKWLQGTYTQRYNSRHEIFGHLFQGRYKAVVVEPEAGNYFAVVSTYVHLNPARAGLIRKDNMGWSGWEEFRNLTPNDKTNLQEQE
jgi:REP element-mobilizing transposase RayT